MMASGEIREGPGHEEMAGLLPAYELDALSEEERKAFAGHVLECDACFDELERGSVVAAEFRASAPHLSTLLGKEPAAPASRGPREGGVRLLLGSWLRPQVAVPALAAAVILVVLLPRTPSPDYRELATFPREKTPSAAVRGASDDDAVRELVEVGAGYFDLGRYDEAARHFAAALDRDPELAEAAYFLGLTRALGDEIESALPPLERAAEIGGENHPKYGWVLANAYLRAGRIADARRALQVLITGGGEYAEKARDLEERLPD
jgi:tetratricopeptide (TPR) repeat protein